MDKPSERVELAQTRSSLHFWGWGCGVGGVWGPSSSLGQNISSQAKLYLEMFMGTPLKY